MARARRDRLPVPELPSFSSPTSWKTILFTVSILGLARMQSEESTASRVSDGTATIELWTKLDLRMSMKEGIEPDE